MTDPVIRPLSAGEEYLFESLSVPPLVGRPMMCTDYRALLARGEYRPEWTYVALRGDTVVAKAAWWATAGDADPIALDWLDFTDHDAAVALLRAAPFRAEYALLLPVGWDTDPEVRAAGEARLSATEAAGMTRLVERYRYRWTPDRGLPPRTGRLTYHPEPDDEVFFALFREIHQGSLDAHSRRTVAEAGLDAAAREDLDILRWMRGPRAGWRVARDESGETVGLTIPTANPNDPVIGYIGVLPAHRGRGYAYALLVEATHLLVAAGADRVAAATDVTNLPMAAAFAKAGYPVVQHRIDMIYPS
ncbi:GNAT family N-acetyltransferase [Actinokineospora auranticolor]|uniref:Acetyltransferase (GNAT) family protein n=1 Tax=Actinokineospora auranticolor TaxID=155976 RepID=A0A2S6GG30_9PSEU|nr:GNAT family N-acetyltransferase [Actinokineospora auranticolor]PPK64096.1 acetyltransferase (GNAT) family protein [Actinokineospora auranticolor]